MELQMSHTLVPENLESFIFKLCNISFHFIFSYSYEIFFCGHSLPLNPVSFFHLVCQLNKRK